MFEVGFIAVQVLDIDRQPQIFGFECLLIVSQNYLVESILDVLVHNWHLKVFRENETGNTQNHQKQRKGHSPGNQYIDSSAVRLFLPSVFVFQIQANVNQNAADDQKGEDPRNGDQRYCQKVFVFFDSEFTEDVIVFFV